MGDGQNNTTLCCEEITFKISLKECNEQQSNSVSTVNVFNLSVKRRTDARDLASRATHVFVSSLKTDGSADVS